MLGCRPLACGRQRVCALARPACSRRSDSAISASVRTSLASAISSIGSRTSGSSPAAAIGAAQPRACRLRRRASSPRKRLRPSTGAAISILRDMAGIAVEIRAPHQRPVDAGRRHFQPIGALDRIGGIEHRRQRARGGLAILDRHRAVRPLGHDLHGAAGGAGNAHAHQPIAEAVEHRLDDSGDTRRPSRLGDQPRLGSAKAVGLRRPCCETLVLT